MGVKTEEGAAPAAGGAVPVTLLSGFLGAGKTTLMKSILEQTHADASGGKPPLKAAVLVNDMAEVNIDANMVSSTKVLQQGEAKMVELHNGCICCTLRADLVKAVGDLAADGSFDAIVIESTGVSVPEEVAETFLSEVPPEAANSPDPEIGEIVKALRGKSSLNALAKLDTCVTLVDCAGFDSNMATAADLSEKFKGSAEEGDDRSVGPLLMSQIEFADVIVLSKCDLISEEEADRVERSVRALNPTAKIVRAVRGDVPLSSVLRTGLFTPNEAPGWVRLLRDKDAHVPETEEYGISSFVYKARTPFHPMRLGRFLDANFTIRFPGYSFKKDPPNAGEAASAEGAPATGAEKRKATREMEKAMQEYQEQMEVEFRDRESRAHERSARMRQSYGHILRSKGYMWIAGRDAQAAEWSQAGAIGQFECGGGWMASLPPQLWPPEGSDEYNAIIKDFDGPVLKDRRQEVVFIGQKLDKDAIKKALDACLITVDDLADKVRAPAYAPRANVKRVPSAPPSG